MSGEFGGFAAMVSRWALWSLPRHVVACVLMVDLAAVVLSVACLWSYPVRPSHVGGLLWIAVCAVAVVEISQRVERQRERHKKSPFKNLHSVWLLPTLLLFPPGAVCLVTVLVYALVWLRVNHFVPHKWIFTASANVLAGILAALTYGALAGPGAQQGELPADARGLLAAFAGTAVLLVVELTLVCTVILLTTPGMGWKAFGTRTDQMLEVAAACFGLLVAAAFTVSPPLIALAMPPVLLLQRTLLVAQLQEQARTDAKTGLANAAWWHELAEREVDRALRLGEQVSVLIADLDHFKQVNDTYGHLAGDAVLRAVAGQLTDGVREYDVVGRFGGEEFVVVLPATGLGRAWEIAERLREQVAALAVPVAGGDGLGTEIDRLTVSIGLAALPDQAEDLSDLLRLADVALYTAKESGRNRVCSAPDLSGPMAPQR